MRIGYVQKRVLFNDIHRPQEAVIGALQKLEQVSYLRDTAYSPQSADLSSPKLPSTY